jgi:hypothetical protein
MGEKEQPIGPEIGRTFGAGESNAAEAGGQAIPTVREETIGDQIQNGLNGANDIEYVEGEMVREPFATVVDHVEVVPGAVLDDRGGVGEIPQRLHSTQEDIATHHAEDVAMHDAEVRSQNPPTIVES